MQIGIEDDATLIGGLPDTSPKGPMHGQWTMVTDGGDTIFTLDITQHLDESAEGIFTSHPALCAITGQSEDCDLGQITGKDIRYISLNEDKALVTVQDANNDKFNLIWSFASGTGKLGNINSANLAPFTASKSE